MGKRPRDALFLWIVVVSVGGRLSFVHAAEPARPDYTPAPLGATKVTGELGRRLKLSFGRLERYDVAFTFQGNPGWPGDREGRAILGQVLLAQATGKPSRHVDALVAELEKRLNPRGYLGPELPAGTFDEQVMSSHGWLLRGLVEYHLWKKDDRSRALIERIVEGLFLPSRTAYARYPIDPAKRPKATTATESSVGKELVDGWRLSSDVGCAFIALDGASAALDLLRSPELEGLVKEMVDRFRQIDVVGVKAQTHATLSAARGALRFALATGRADVIPFVEKTFATYRARGMTDHFANDNWFGRPNWTEGCAIVDSYDLAVRLFVATGKASYLEDAQHIYWNGLGFNQRPNGGFGCDSCPGSDGKATLAPHHELFEAFACCSMRGGEGMARATQNAFLVRSDGVLLPDFQDAETEVTIAGGPVTFRERTRWPFEGKVSLTVLRARTTGIIDVRFFVPSFVARDRIVARVGGKPSPVDLIDGGLAVFRIEAKPGATIELELPVTIRTVVPVNAAKMPGQHGFRHGPLVLGAEGDGTVVLPAAAAFTALGRAAYESKDGRVTLRPITGLAFLPEAQARAFRRQILFADQ